MAFSPLTVDLESLERLNPRKNRLPQFGPAGITFALAPNACFDSGAGIFGAAASGQTKAMAKTRNRRANTIFLPYPPGLL